MWWFVADGVVLQILRKMTGQFSACVCPIASAAFLSWPGSSIYGISQARILERVAISSSRRSSQLRSPALAGEFFTTEPPGSLLTPISAESPSWESPDWCHHS